MSSFCSSSSFAQTRRIFLPSDRKTRIALPTLPLTIAPPRDFAQTCSPFPSPALCIPRWRSPIRRPIIISSPPLDDEWINYEEPFSPLRFGNPDLPVFPPGFWDSCVPCYDGQMEDDEYHFEDPGQDGGEMETARSTHSADLEHLEITKWGSERGRRRRSSLPADVEALGEMHGRMEARVHFGRIRVEGRIWRWLKGVEKAEREEEMKRLGK